VTGCLGVKSNLIEKHHPSVLAITGPHDTPAVMRAVRQHLPKPHEPFVDLIPEAGIRLTPKHYAYLKISEGCNHRCSFCIIPSMRGDLVSRPVGEVMREAENLARAGVQEILVIAQDTSAYGLDLKYRTDFHGGKPLKTKLYDLCKNLGQLGIWIRLHYVYPYPHVDDVIPLMADGKILPYLDVPFQHASRRMLKLMKRPADAEDNLARIRAWREVCSEIAIRSTFVVGFPGETETEFEELLDFLGEAKLDRVGCFAYSAVEGVQANDLPDAVPEEAKRERRARLMQLQEKISSGKLKAKIGKTLAVLVDAPGMGRSYADAPEVDGVVRFKGAGSAGEFVNVRIERASAHDLFGREA